MTELYISKSDNIDPETVGQLSLDQLSTRKAMIDLALKSLVELRADMDKFYEISAEEIHLARVRTGQFGRV